MSIPKTTRQYYYTELGSYENLKSREVPLQPPKSFEVLVRTRAVSLQYRDLMIANKTYPAQFPPELVPCSDMAGEIVFVGEDVKGWKKGDKVCLNFAADHIHGDVTPEIQNTGHGGQVHGVLTQYKVVRPHSLVRIPDHLSFEEASTLPCAALTAYNALWGPVPLKSGDTILVQGTGGVSIFALQFATASGANVIATSSSDEKLKIAQKLGAKHLINYKKTPDWDKEVHRITNGRGVDHIVEVGGAGTLEKSMNSIRFGGWIHAIGFVAGAGNGQDRVIAQAVFKALSIRGIQIGSVAQFEAMNRMISSNPDTTRPVVDKVFPFEEAVKAYVYLESQAHVGKVVIKVD
ncbi:NAD(P)-binding protein [Marasmius fiardii PR-910]|nr:NAD(P)-binding protein [Marasmius fiardii PR-910]